MQQGSEQSNRTSEAGVVARLTLTVLATVVLLGCSVGSAELRAESLVFKPESLAKALLLGPTSASSFRESLLVTGSLVECSRCDAGRAESLLLGSSLSAVSSGLLTQCRKQ